MALSRAHTHTEAQQSLNIPGSVPLSGSTPNVNGVYSGPRAILHPSFCENLFSSFCVILLTNQPTKGPGPKCILLGGSKKKSQI